MGWSNYPDAGYPPGPRRGLGLRWLFVGFGVVLLAIGVLLVLVAASPSTFGLSRDRFLFPFGGGLIGIVIILWGTMMVVRAAWWASRRGPYGRAGFQRRRFDPAIMAARQRYARGEITREQFQQIVTDLRGPRGPPPP